MELKVCKNCRKLFSYIYGPELCPACAKLLPDGKNEINKEYKAALSPKVKENEDRFEQVKDYIVAHPSATVLQISDENKVTPAQLFEWIKDERLEFSDDSSFAWFTCEICGAKIKSGRICNQCKITGHSR